MTRKTAVTLALLAGVVGMDTMAPHGAVLAQKVVEVDLGAAGVSGAAGAAEKSGSPDIPNPSKWSVMAGIDLTSDQKAAIIKAVAQYAQYEDMLTGQLKAQARYPDSLSRAKASTTKDQISENRLSQVYAVRNILTEEQRVTFDNNLAEVIARYQKRKALEAVLTAKTTE